MIRNTLAAMADPKAVVETEEHHEPPRSQSTLEPTHAMWERRASSLDPHAVATARQSIVDQKARRLTIPEIEQRVREGSVPQVKGEFEALQIAKEGGWEIEALILEMEAQDKADPAKKSFFQIQYKDPKHFTWFLVAFASMGGLLSGLDQSLISGANLYLPKDLGLTTRQNSLVNSGMPLGAVGGALLLSPANEIFGRKNAIILSTVLYTIGAALEAGSINFGKQCAIENDLSSNY